MLIEILSNLYLALAAYAVAQIADVVTTTRALRSGRGREANPVIRWAMEATGRAWPLVKAVIVGAAAVGVVTQAGPLWLWPVTVGTAAVAWWNSRQ